MARTAKLSNPSLILRSCAKLAGSVARAAVAAKPAFKNVRRSKFIRGDSMRRDLCSDPWAGKFKEEVEENHELAFQSPPVICRPLMRRSLPRILVTRMNTKRDREVNVFFCRLGVFGEGGRVEIARLSA